MDFTIRVRHGDYYVDLAVTEATLAAATDAELARALRAAVNAVRLTATADTLTDVPLGQPVEALAV